MTPQQLLECIRILTPTGAVTDALTAALPPGTRPPWYTTQKQHWEGWLEEYDGPGLYGRARSDRTAAFVYNHVQCAPMLLWLAQAVGVARERLCLAVAAVLDSGPRYSRQCAALREVIPWSAVEQLLNGRAAVQEQDRNTGKRGT